MTEALSLILGSVMPFFIDFLTKNVANSKARMWISFGACALVGLIVVFKTPKIEEIIESIALVFTAATLVYKQYWKDSALRNSENK